MRHYFDASALARRYVSEPGNTAIRAFFRRRPVCAMARIGHAEVVSAIARGHREGVLSEAEQRRLLARLEEDLREFDIVEVRPALIRAGVELLCKHPLRTNDAIHLAAALALKQGAAVAFWCADDRLIAAAKAEGLRATRC